MDRTAHAAIGRATALVVAAVAAWAALLAMVVFMADPAMTGGMAGSDAEAHAGLAAAFAMWAVMMAAMMLPGAMPMVLGFVRLSLQQGEAVRAGMFVAAYLLVWCGFSAAATGLQWLLQALGWVDPMIAARSPVLAAALLFAAGAYQFSPLKRACLSKCRTPIGFLLGEWRPGPRGAFVMGVRHGIFCLGCCWALMVLLFVHGVMNLAWILILAVAVALERLAPGGELIARALGWLLIALGVIRLAAMALSA